MKKSIYKIQNKLNNKIYIGQSIHPDIRFKEHCQLTCQHRSLIHQAIQKYGKDNFDFEILEFDIENYDEREKYWIQYYNSLVPNGYNISSGGEYHPDIQYGENCCLSLYTDDQFNQCIDLLLNTQLSTKEISEKIHVTKAFVLSVNAGTARSIYPVFCTNFPLRNVYKKINAEKLNNIISLLLNSDYSQVEIAKITQVSRSMISQINTGSLYHNDNLNYPLRIKYYHKSYK